MSERLEDFMDEHREDFDSYKPGKRVWEGLEKNLTQYTSPLEQFVTSNREAFDSYEPSSNVWAGIQKDLPGSEEKKGVVKKMTWMRWAVAASVVLILGSGAYYFTKTDGTTSQDPQLATRDLRKVEQTPADTNATRNEQPELGSVTPQEETNIAKENNPQPKVKDDTDPMQEEMYHYARLVEIKQNEIKRIKKDEPLLYKQFAGDINALDSTYRSLKQQLPKNQNREQLLEAMIENLQLQTKLLNQQLNIIKQINQSKKSVYDKAYKTI